MDVDRISSLPDGILQHILSFLETRCAAQTSLLSKRWRYMWEYTPALDFYSANPWEHGNFDLPDLWKYSMVQRAIAQHKSSSLHRFRLHTYRINTAGIEFINKLPAVLMRYSKVLELHLSFWDHQYIGGTPIPICKLPNGMVSSGNLRVLELVRCEINDIGSINLAMVETLSLTQVHASDEVFNLLISSCTVVKKLELMKCCNVSNIELSLKELRELKLVWDSNLTRLIVEAPKLCHVNFCLREIEGEFSLKNSWDLKYAILDYHFDNYFATFKDIVCGLGSAKALTLHCRHDSPLPLDLFENCSSTFCNVKQLEVTMNYPSSVVGILNLFPHLEDFTFHCHYQNIRKERRKQQDEDDYHHFSVYCLRHSLRRIGFTKFEGLACQFELAKFLVENASVLKLMRLITRKGHFMNIREMEHILKSSRACDSAKIIFA